MQTYSYLKWKLFVMLFSLSAIGLSQTDTTSSVYDKIYLKDGSILVGAVLEYLPGEHVTLETSQGVNVTVPMEVVKKVIQEVPGGHKSKYSFKERGVYHSSSAGLIFNAVSAERGGLTGFELSSVIGYQLNQFMGFGLGGSADFYHRQAGEMVFPIFLECRGYLIRKPVSPYFTFRTGYGIAIRNEDLNIVDAEGGWMFNPAIGWRFGNGNKGVFTLDMGVKWQNASFQYGSNQERSAVDLQYRRMNIRFGLLF